MSVTDVGSENLQGEADGRAFADAVADQVGGVVDGSSELEYDSALLPVALLWEGP